MTEIVGKVVNSFWKVSDFFFFGWISLGFLTCSWTYSLIGNIVVAGAKREIEDRIVPRSADADDADVDVKSDDERFVTTPVLVIFHLWQICDLPFITYGLMFLQKAHWLNKRLSYTTTKLLECVMY